MHLFGHYSAEEANTSRIRSIFIRPSSCWEKPWLPAMNLPPYHYNCIEFSANNANINPFVHLWIMTLPRLAAGTLLSEAVNNDGRSGWGGGQWGGGGLHFPLYLPSPSTGEPRRKLQTSRPLSCTEERAEARQVAKSELLGEHNCVCACICAIARWHSRRFFPFVCSTGSEAGRIM